MLPHILTIALALIRATSKITIEASWSKTSSEILGVFKSATGATTFARQCLYQPEPDYYAEAVEAVIEEGMISIDLMVLLTLQNNGSPGPYGVEAGVVQRPRGTQVRSHIVLLIHS